MGEREQQQLLVLLPVARLVVIVVLGIRDGRKLRWVLGVAPPPLLHHGGTIMFVDLLLLRLWLQMRTVDKGKSSREWYLRDGNEPRWGHGTCLPWSPLGQVREARRVSLLEHRRDLYESCRAYRRYLLQHGLR